MRAFVLFVILSCVLKIYAQKEDILSDAFYSYRENGKYGIKYRGEIVMYPHYDSLFIDKMGAIGCIGTYKKDDKYGILSHTKIVGPPIYEDVRVIWLARTFDKDWSVWKNMFMAIVKIKGKSGLVDFGGNYILKPEYDYIGEKPIYEAYNKSEKEKGNVFFEVRKEGEMFLVDLLGRMVVSPEEYMEKRKERKNIACKMERKLSKNNECLINPIIDRIECLSDSCENYSVMLNYVDSVKVCEGKIYNKGKLITPNSYDKIYMQENGVMRVVKNNKYGLIDCAYGEIIPCRYDYISSFSENGIAEIQDRGFKGRVNKCGYISLPYDFLKPKSSVELAYSYAPQNIYVIWRVADKLLSDKCYDKAYEVYDFLLEKIKQDKIETKLLSSIERDRKKAYDWANGKNIQPESQETGWDILFGLLNSTANIVESVQNNKNSNHSVSSNSFSDETSSHPQKRAIRDNNNAYMTNGNYRIDSRTYSNWESELIKMNAYPEKYNNICSESKVIQQKMKTLRERIISNGGTCSKSQWEDKDFCR